MTKRRNFEPLYYFQSDTLKMLCGKSPNIARGNDIFTLTILRNKILACQLAIEMSSGKGNNESESKHAWWSPENSIEKVAETSVVFPPNKAFAMSNCPKCQKKVKSTEDYQFDYMGLIPERCWLHSEGSEIGPNCARELTYPSQSCQVTHCYSNYLGSLQQK